MSRKVLILVAVAVGGLAIVWWGILPQTTLQGVLPAGGENITVSLKLLDAGRKALPAGAVPALQKDEVRPESPSVGPPVPTAPLPASLPNKGEGQVSDTPTGATRRVALPLLVSPLALSLSVQHPEKLERWWSDGGVVKELLESPLGRGFLRELTSVFSSRAEDLKLEGLQGKFLEMVPREIVGAEFSLHYDRGYGKDGLVAVFTRAQAPLSSKLLPLLVRNVCTKKYVLKSFENAVIECTLSGRRFFLHERAGKVFVGQSFGALLNALVQEDLEPRGDPDAPFLLRVRSEAFLGSLQSVLLGTPHWHMDFVGTGGDGAGELRLASTPALNGTQGSTPRGILAAIPADVAAAIGGNFPITASLSGEELERFVRSGQSALPASFRPGSSPQQGLAILWDLHGEANGAPVEIGAVSVAGSGATNWRGFFRNEILTADCADHTVYLAASSELLLTRMKESCERQSTSLLTLLERRSDTPLPELFLLTNFGTVGKELLLRGVDRELLKGNSGTALGQGGAPQDPEWKAAYRTAVQQAVDSSTTVLQKLPAVLFLGAREERGARLRGSFVK